METEVKVKTAVEIIEETINFYSEDPKRRAMIKGECVYLSPEGNMCAVGRCLIDPASDSIPNTGGIEDLVSCSEEGTLDSILKPEYIGQSEEFWANLQQLHDGVGYWNLDGLTEIGKNRANQLLEKYKFN